MIIVFGIERTDVQKCREIAIFHFFPNVDCNSNDMQRGVDSFKIVLEATQKVSSNECFITSRSGNNSRKLRKSTCITQTHCVHRRTEPKGSFTATGRKISFALEKWSRVFSLIYADLFPSRFKSNENQRIEIRKSKKILITVRCFCFPKKNQFCVYSFWKTKRKCNICFRHE